MRRLRSRLSRSSGGTQAPSSTRRSSPRSRPISRGSASSPQRNWPRSSSSDVASPSVVLALPVVVAIVLGLALGGSVGRLAEIRLRAAWLFLAAVALPVDGMPWRTHDTVASVLWIASYGLLVVAAVLNRRLTGVPVVAVGMCL